MQLKKLIAKYPKETLLDGPTPLQHLTHLSQKLNTNVYLKREDLTHLTLGGDKPRKLEYEIAQARLNGADTLVTCGSMQSNHARLTTAAARKLGFDCAIVMSQDNYAQIQGNLLTVHLMGAEVRVVEVEDHWDLESHVLRFCEELKQAGKKPHYIPVSGTTPHSCLGYVSGGLEMVEQLDQMQVNLTGVYTPFGTGGIFTAMLLTFRQNGIWAPFYGISVNGRLPKMEAYHTKWWQALCQLLEQDPAQQKGDFALHDEFIGREYGHATEECLDAVLLMAETEGILLDPVYSGKVFAAFLNHHASGRWGPDDHVMLVHSGGVPALFAYHQEIEAHLKKRGRL